MATELAPTAENYMNAFMGKPGTTLAPTAANYMNAFSGSGTGTGTGTGLGGFFENLGNLGGSLGKFLGGAGGSLIGAGLSIDELNSLRDVAEKASTGMAEIGRTGAEAAAFKPFTVSTGFGGVSTTPEGGFATTLDPQQAEQQRKLQALTGTLLGGMGAGIPDVSGIQEQALGGVGGFLTGAMAPMAQREADVYERIRATQRPEEQRAQLALEERLASQGRTGLRTAQFGGSPEQFALAQAQEEAKARASLGALGQAQAEQLQQAGLAQSMFGLGSGAAALPASLQQGQLGNIGAALGLQYLPEQQLLASLTPGIQLASLADLGRRQGAGLMTEAGVSGLEDIVGAEQARAANIAQIYSALLSAQGQQAAASAGGISSGIGGLFGEIGDVGSDILSMLGIS
jgi:hypothetical protein